MISTETLVLVICEPEVFLFSDDGGWWKKLWSGGCQGSGSLCLSDRRLVFLKSSASQRLASCGPCPQSAEEMSSLLSSQGGRDIALQSILRMQITAQGIGPYGYGRADISDLTIEFQPIQTIRLRFFGSQAAGGFLQRVQELQRGGHAPPASPVAVELQQLGIPVDFGLPPTPEDAAYIIWLRATVGFAYRTLANGRADLAVGDANKLINDPRLAVDRRFALILAAAYCIRGMAWEQSGRSDLAKGDYQAALQVRPGYGLAQQRLAMIRG